MHWYVMRTRQLKGVWESLLVWDIAPDIDRAENKNILNKKIYLMCIVFSSQENSSCIEPAHITVKMYFYVSLSSFY